jgi:uncharacterized membrane protein
MSWHRLVVLAMGTLANGRATLSLTMRKPITLLSLILSAFALGAAVPAAAGAAAGAPAPAVRTQQARFGGGFRTSRRPLFGSRSRSPYSSRGYYRRSPFHGFGRSILRGLGIAYLFHLAFGWGAGGGSPFGLLIVVAVIVWLVTRRRRRRYAY